MDDSILNTIKKQLGITEDYTVFDNDLIMHINSVFLTLSQLGVGPDEGFFIEGKTDSWTDYIDEGVLLNSIKTYVYLKVKLLFDPPQASSLLEAINSQLKEIEWRMYVQKGGF